LTPTRSRDTFLRQIKHIFTCLIAHFERAMEKARFVEFRRCFNEERLAFIDGESKIDQLYNNMVSSFPELDVNYELPELNANFGEDFDEEMEEEEVRPKKKPKDFAEIERKLRESLDFDADRFIDYAPIVLNTDDENSCIQTLRLLDKAESDAKRRIIYFSALKGEVLKKLREVSGKKMKTLLQMTSYKQSHAYFLMNLHDLIFEYNKLMHSKASLNFFKSNMRQIKIICQENAMFFK